MKDLRSDLRWGGIWITQAQYRSGELVYHRNLIWHAEQDYPQGEPVRGNEHWSVFAASEPPSGVFLFSQDVTDPADDGMYLDMSLTEVPERTDPQLTVNAQGHVEVPILGQWGIEVSIRIAGIDVDEVEDGSFSVKLAKVRDTLKSELGETSFNAAVGGGEQAEEWVLHSGVISAPSSVTLEVLKETPNQIPVTISGQLGLTLLNERKTVQWP